MKTKIISVLSLGFVIFGIGCVIWSVYSLQTQSKSSYSNYNNQSYELISTNNSSEDNLEDIIVEKEKDKVVYLEYPAEGDIIGSLTIPALKQEFPIVQGTGEEELKKGVGHFLQSVLPGEEDNCVISGHRDTVFRKLGDLKVGDLLIIQTSAGTFTYEVDGTKIVLPEDETVIVPTDKAVLTMTTCYPFNYVLDATERFIVSAILIKSE